MNGLTCNMRSSGKYERWEEGGMYMGRKYIVDQNNKRSMVVLDHSRKFKSI